VDEELAVEQLVDALLVEQFLGREGRKFPQIIERAVEHLPTAARAEIQVVRTEVRRVVDVSTDAAQQATPPSPDGHGGSSNEKGWIERKTPIVRSRRFAGSAAACFATMPSSPGKDPGTGIGVVSVFLQRRTRRSRKTPPKWRQKRGSVLLVKQSDIRQIADGFLR
jgi:hypothetical protein